MIGDKYSDIEFGKNAGLTTILVKTGDGEKEFLQNRHKWKVKPDYVVENLLSAANLIEKIRR
jgi:ribonucleotide monophosphatase NagD (HAD superfamily)